MSDEVRNESKQLDEMGSLPGPDLSLLISPNTNFDSILDTIKQIQTEREAKAAAYKIVFNDLMQNPMFTGKYDAAHGSQAFMHGISTLMENIAWNVSQDCYEDFQAVFSKNMAESLEKADC